MLAALEGRKQGLTGERMQAHVRKAVRQAGNDFSERKLRVIIESTRRYRTLDGGQLQVYLPLNRSWVNVLTIGTRNTVTLGGVK